MSKEQKGYTCIARTLECSHSGVLNCYKIVTLHIEDGKVKKIEKTQPFMASEARGKLEDANYESFFNLNLNWKEGLPFQK